VESRSNEKRARLVTGDSQGKIAAPVERTCLGCRRALSRETLLRVAFRHGHLAADFQNKADGRGAYICLNKECLEVVRKKKGIFPRALRANISPAEVEKLFGELTDILNSPFDSGACYDNTK